MGGGNTLSSGLLLLLLGVWLFVRVFWGHLPHKIVSAV
jgi:hypothetical protein